jgi:hypothetical protein
VYEIIFTDMRKIGTCVCVCVCVCVWAIKFKRGGYSLLFKSKFICHMRRIQQVDLTVKCLLTGPRGFELATFRLLVQYSNH